MKTQQSKHTPGPAFALVVATDVAFDDLKALGRTTNQTARDYRIARAKALAADEVQSVLLEALQYYASPEAKEHGYDNGALARSAIAQAKGEQ